MAIVLTLRAGLLKNVNIETFNIHGIVGFGILVGLYSESILERIITVQNKMIGIRNGDSSG